MSSQLVCAVCVFAFDDVSSLLPARSLHVQTGDGGAEEEELGQQVRTKQLLAQHVAVTCTDCFLSPQHGVSVPAAADGSAPAERRLGAERPAAARPRPLPDRAGSRGSRTGKGGGRRSLAQHFNLSK